MKNKNNPFRFKKLGKVKETKRRLKIYVVFAEHENYVMMVDCDGEMQHYKPQNFEPKHFMRKGVADKLVMELNKTGTYSWGMGYSVSYVNGLMAKVKESSAHFKKLQQDSFEFLKS